MKNRVRRGYGIRISKSAGRPHSVFCVGLAPSSESWRNGMGGATWTDNCGGALGPRSGGLFERQRHGRGLSRARSRADDSAVRAREDAPGGVFSVVVWVFCGGLWILWGATPSVHASRGLPSRVSSRVPSSTNQKYTRDGDQRSVSLAGGTSCHRPYRVGPRAKVSRTINF